MAESIPIRCATKEGRGSGGGFVKNALELPEKFFPRSPFDPWKMAAVMDQDETEVGNGVLKRAFDAFRGMRISVAVKGDDRTADVASDRNEFPPRPEPGRLLPHLAVNLEVCAGGSEVQGHWIDGVGLREENADARERRVLAFARRDSHPPKEFLGFFPLR